MNTQSTIVSNVGKIRENNEDSFVFLQSIGAEKLNYEKTLISTESIQCFGVFDGMGGHSRGEVASSIAAKNFLEISKRIQLRTMSETKEFLSSAIKTLNDSVCLEIRKSKERIGSTATILVFREKTAFLAHLGDSSCFLFRKGELVKLSKDHVDQYTSVEQKKKKAKLTQYLGIFENEFVLEPELCEIQVEPSDIYLLMSDGLTDLVSEIELSEEVRKCKNVVKLRESLFKLYEERGAIDNMTLCITEVRSVL